MVSVSLIPRRGNSTKFFPHSGHLGLTPVVVAGTLKLEWSENESNSEVAELLVRLRCYEAIGGQAQIIEHTYSENRSPENLNLLWETVSTASSSLTLQRLKGDYQTEWKLIVPRSATDNRQHGFAVGSMTYKNWKSWWQLEGVVRLAHKNKMITKCYPLHLKNFHPLSSLGTLRHVQGSSHNPNIIYSLSCPAQVSCGDVVTVNVSLKTSEHQSDRDLNLRKIIITLERNLAVDTELSDKTKLFQHPNHASGNSWSTCLLSDVSSKSKEHVTPKLRYTQSLGKLRSKAKLPCRLPPIRKPVVSVIQVAEIPIIQNDTGQRASPMSMLAWHGRVDLAIPRPKSAYHYSIGDTCKTKFVSVTYHVRAQVVIKTMKGSTEMVNLGSSEVELSSVPALDRESACGNYKKNVTHFSNFKETASVSSDSQNLSQFGSQVVAPSTMTV